MKIKTGIPGNLAALIKTGIFESTRTSVDRLRRMLPREPGVEKARAESAQHRRRRDAAEREADDDVYPRARVNPHHQNDREIRD
jgi:hypothetical protein